MDTLLDRALQADGADVYDGDRLAATLRYDGNQTTFAYSPEWRQHGGRPVSLSLPVDDEPRHRGGRGVPAALAGLLPEGRRLTALRRAIKTSADDDLSMLIAIGGDVVGHIRVALPGERPVSNDVAVNEGLLGKEPFASLVARAIGVWRLIG